MTIYEIWEPQPAPNRGGDWQIEKARGKPYDEDWENWSYPIGNGYMGANLFGRVDTERIQLTEKTLHNQGPYRNGGLTSFAEIYLDFDHGDVQAYRRSLSLNEAIAHVSYSKDGVTYRREHFMSYPDNVMVVKLTADKKGALSFVVRPEIPYLGRDDQRTGTVTTEGDVLTLFGAIPFFDLNYEGQVKALVEGGAITSDPDRSVLAIDRADSVVLLVAAGTNYHLSEKVFLSANEEKLDPQEFPHDRVSSLIAAAQDLGYEALKKRHLQDYRNLFDRASIRLASKASADPTSTLLRNYQQGDENPWIEELMCQYGRYLLLASSREKTLPSGLQGGWSQYHVSPWSGGYWHNINVQMNYWGAMSANLAECFEAYIEYFKAYLPKARQFARDYVRANNPARLDQGDGDNGWILGTGANAYHISSPGGHSGPGTGGFTSKLLMEYYQFSQDRQFLEDVAYPTMHSLSDFYSKALVAKGDLLLVSPSASPEQKPEGTYYITTGCTFDQGFVWENFRDTLALAQTLGKEDELTERIRQEITRLDPIQVGASGQIKEYREETQYSDIGDPHHRHISHLCPLFPGTLITSGQPEWVRAASKTLDLRGDKTTGWAMAHRMNCRARLKEGDKAHAVYRQFIRERTANNLWTLHPPFQIDGSLGVMAGVIEMLLQSHEDCIEILPALPRAWPSGSFSGLVARGNFLVDAEWKAGEAVRVTIVSRSGGECHVVCSGIASARIEDDAGGIVTSSRADGNRIAFETTQNRVYSIALR